MSYIPTISDTELSGAAEFVDDSVTEALNPADVTPLDAAGEVISTFIDGAGAIGATALTDLVNLPLMLFDTKLESTDFMTNDAAEFQSDNPLLTDVGSLVVGGLTGVGLLGVAAKGAAKAAKLSGLYRHGTISIFDSGSALAKVAASERVLKEAGLHSQKYSDSVSALWAKSLGVGFAEGAAQEAAFALATSQNPLMRDYDGMDFLLGAGIGGVVSTVFRGFGGALEVRKYAAENSKGVRADLANTNPTYVMGADKGTNIAVTAQSVLKTRELADGASVAGDTGIVKTYTDYSIDMEAHLTKQLDDLVSEPLKLAKADGNAFEITELHSLLKIDMAMDNPQAIMGMDELIPFKHTDHTVGFSKAVETQADIPIPNAVAKLDLTNGEFDTYGRYVDALRNAGDTPDYIMDGLRTELKGYAPKQAKLIQELAEAASTTTFLSTRTKTFHGIADLHKIGNGADFGITTNSVKPHGTLSSPQAQFNLAHAARTINKSADPAVLGEVSAMPYDKLFKLGYALSKFAENSDRLEAITKGVTLEGKAASIGDVAAAVHNATHLEITRLAFAGVDEFEISLRTGLTPTVVREFRAGAKPSLDYKASTNLSGEFKRTIATAKGRSFEVNANIARDGDMVHELNGRLVDLALLGTKSENAAKVVASLSPHNPNSVTAAIHAQLAGIAPELYNGVRRNFVSVDFALRNQSLVNATTAMGDAVKRTAEQLNKSWAKPIIGTIKLINANSVERIEFNKQLNWLYSKNLKPNQSVIVQGKALVVAETSAAGSKIVETSDIVLSALQADFFKNYRATYVDMLEVGNLNRKLIGADRLIDYGIKLPAQHLQAKYLAYVTESGKPTTVLHASTVAGLEELMRAEQALIKAAGSKAEVVPRGSRLNEINNYGDLDTLGLADSMKAKTSAQFTVADTGSNQIQGLLEAISTQASISTRKTASILNQNSLGFLSRMHRESNLTKINQGTRAAETEERTVYSTLRNTMLNTKDTVAGDKLDQGYDWLEDIGNTTISAVTKATASLVPAKGLYQAKQFENLKQEFYNAGLKAPYKDMEDMVRSTIAHKNGKQPAEAMVQFMTGSVSTMALRFLETAHGLVTATSVPIMTLPEISSSMRQAGHGNYSSMKLMTEGIRVGFGHKAEHVAFQKRMIDQGVIAEHVSEHAENLAKLVANPSLYHKLVPSEKFRKSLTIVSDRSEYLARQAAAGMGYVVGKRVLGAKATQGEIDAYASGFVKRTMGNYNAVQRPMAFQGTMGSALGLFQTYILTYAQRVFKSAENFDTRALVTMGAAQAGLFGVRSLPAYDLMNESIGSHYMNTDNSDTDTFMYEKFGGDDGEGNLAESALYGLPSAMLGANLSSRASIDLRTPISFSPVDGFSTDMAVLQLVSQGSQFMTNLTNDMLTGSSFDDSLISAMASQSLSRPIARYTELLLTKTSVDRAGRVYDADVGFKLDQSTVARVLATRPIKEDASRNSKRMGSYYAGLDSDKKRSALQTMRKSLAAGSLDDEELLAMQSRYLNHGGSGQRWQAIVNEAVMQSEHGYDFSKLVGKDKAQHRVLRLLDGTGTE